MKRILLCLLVVVTIPAFSACQTIVNFIPTQTPYPTHTPNPTYTPNPTFTPYPTLTLTLTPTANPILFEEYDFDGVDESCFPAYSSAEVQEFAKEGQYHIVVRERDYFGWSTCDTEMRNFIMEVDATPLEANTSDSYAYGLLFRRDANTESFYTFLISPDGLGTMTGEFPNDFYTLLSWTNIREIEQGMKTNHLKVIGIGDQFELYVNDALVGLVRESTFRSGSFGFIVETFNDDEVEVAFDNLVITEP